MMPSLRDDFDQEYHSFGPWLIEINDAHHIPPQYNAIDSIIEDAAFSFKVPVAIDRRDAKPGMLLYKQLVCLTGDHLISFTINQHKLIRSDTTYDAIIYMTKSCDLLANQLIIGTTSGIITIDYNAVSEDVINAALVHIRTRLLALTEIPICLKAVDFPVHLSMMLKNLLALEAVTTPLDLIAYQPTTHITSIRSSFMNRLISIVNPKVLQASAVFVSPKEMIVYTRLKQIKRSREVDYGYKFTYIPMTQLSEINFQDSDLYNDLDLIELDLGNHQLTLYCKDQQFTNSVKAFYNR